MEKFLLKNQCIINQIKFVVSIAVLTVTFLSTSIRLASAIEGNETDRLALLALKQHLVGANSPGPLLSWNASLHFCYWYGIRCDRNRQRVIGLQLVRLKVAAAGTISPSIGNLSALRLVNLSDNSLQGTIPREFGYLKQLRLLDLSNNDLHGNIPIELNNCSSIQNINLILNRITGKIPFGSGDYHMKNLTILTLAANYLSGGIPSSLANLSSLDFLGLSRNQLEGNIPNDLSRLSNLKVLVFSRNNLSGTIPSSIYNLSSLTYIDMGSNQLSGEIAPEIGFLFPKLGILYIGGKIPRSLANISILDQLDINSNGFCGPVPENLGKLQNLTLLAIDYNHLGSGKDGDLDFVSSLTNCSGLKVLDCSGLKVLAIHNNRFGGVLPDSITNLSTQIEVLFMGENQISGNIQGSGNLVKLTQIDLGGNLLTGKIPSSIGRLQNLVTFNLSMNHLSGPIPSSIGNLSQLSLLDLNGNNFEGRVPLTLKNCKDMSKLYISGNELHGDLSNQLIGSFEKLITLNLSHNSFTGVFPSDIVNSKDLVELYVNNNNFIGGIPSQIGEISGLRFLHMQGNHFNGSIPLSFGLLRATESLDLSANNLSNTIPSELQKLPFLVSLNLSFSRLEGEVPQEGVFKNTSQFSIIGNQNLCGGIPEIQLPRCSENQEAKNKGSALSTQALLIMILSILIVSILVAVIVVFGWRKRSRRELINRPATPLLSVGCSRVSYQELLEATNGFSAPNLLGEGAFGTVYKGILYQHKNPIVVKVLNLQNVEASKSFEVECEALRKIRHRNLVKVITSCSSVDFKGNHFKAIVLEFMANGSLDKWLKCDSPRHLNFGQMLDVAIDVGNALDHLHHHCESMIIHRDLKPANILLNNDMVAHVSDFGIAKILSDATGKLGFVQATSSLVQGTIGYVAPEYGMGGPTSREGDIYSYGILLLEMITGKTPTDDLFNNGSGLHNFCKMALMSLQQLKEIVDFRLLKQINNPNKSQNMKVDGDDIIWKCFVAFINVGVACSVEVPFERMKIEDAIKELHAIKRVYQYHRIVK
ncbi:putative receptor-like protein kinase At3g47110 [Gossypium arboreum]|uniref:Protein kinase domain-containing protein n=1 Tax=Gossypium arboreum TaxID=29729 RepID=A0ABR0NKJ0_GOSAR|nr:putative receptor-like protein kinase At3g47110 [Gossypium arboreum]KAK5795167.1 hypothetical protein PVK06_036425 [Gossypium arboreum]